MNGELLIGGNFIPEDKREEHVEKLRSNRSIIVLPLNDEANESPDLKPCATVDAVFATYKPKVRVLVKGEDGASREREVAFRKLKDFAAPSLVDAIPELLQQSEDIAVLENLRSELRQNARLRGVADDSEGRQKLVACLQQALRILEGAD